MKILITGSSGRIGSEVVHQLLELGHTVVGIDMTKPATPQPGAYYHTGKLTNAEVVAQSLEGVDAVAHLAACMSWNPKDSVTIFQDNVEGTFKLLEASVRFGVGRFVFASTGEVYPELRPQYLPIDESHPLEPLSAYGETKVLGEEMIRYYQQRMNLPAVVLRFPHTQTAKEILDPDSFFSGPRFFLQAKIRQMQTLNKPDMVTLLARYASGKSGELQHLIQCDQNGQSYAMHISDVRDTARGVVLALTHPDAVGETFNLGTDHPVVFSEAVPKMARITGCEIVSVNMPGFPVKYCTSNKKIKTLLGFAPQFTFDAMLEEAAALWKDRQKTCVN